MSLIFDGMMAGLGKGIAGMGEQWANAQLRMDHMREQAELRRQERLDYLKEQGALRMAQAQASMDPTKGLLADVMRNSVNLNPTDRARFTSNVDISDGTDVTETKTQFDQAGYDKAERDRIERNLDVVGRGLNPGHYKTLQEGMKQGQINEWISKLDGMDPEQKRDTIEMINQVNGKEIFKLNANGQVVSTLFGDVKNTDLTDAEIEKREAAADKDKRTDPNVRATRGSGRDLTIPTGSNELQYISKRIKDLEVRLKDLVGPRNAAERAEVLSEISAWEEKAEEVRNRNPAAAQSKPAAAPSLDKPNAPQDIPTKTYQGKSYPAPRSKAEAESLPPGTVFWTPSGLKRR